MTQNSSPDYGTQLRVLEEERNDILRQLEDAWDARDIANLEKQLCRLAAEVKELVANREAAINRQAAGLRSCKSQELAELGNKLRQCDIVRSSSMPLVFGCLGCLATPLFAFVLGVIVVYCSIITRGRAIPDSAARAVLALGCVLGLALTVAITICAQIKANHNAAVQRQKNEARKIELQKRISKLQQIDC